MGEVQKKKKVINYRKLLELEKIRSEDYLKKLKYLQADYENLKNRTDRQIVEAKKILHRKSHY